MYNFKNRVEQKLTEINKTTKDLADNLDINEDTLIALINNPNITKSNNYIIILRELKLLELEYSRSYIPGKVIKKHLQKNNMNQKDLAELLSVNEGTVSKYIKGTRKLPQNIIIQLCDIFDISADELLGIK